MFQAFISGGEGRDEEVCAQSRDFAGIVGMRDERVLILGVQRRERPRQIADIRADTEVAEPPDVDDDMQRLSSRRIACALR